MANPFYTPSGNPATGAPGLSLLMRTEFAAISAAFDMMPSFETTGLYTTTFNQQGTFTFTLPAQPGILALTSDVAAETARATAAEVVNATAIATKQGALGYNPVQQGTGVGQLGNVVKIGWSPGGLAYTIDVTNEGYFVTTSNPQGFALSADVATAVATEQARAIAAEGVNTAAIATEATARTAETVRATAAEAVNALTAANNVGRNRLHNGAFRVNQRGYVSGTALADETYGHDRWRAPSGGGTYTFTQAQPTTLITITAGSLIQVLDPIDVEGGTYTLSWVGTAPGTINGGPSGSSPITVTGVAANLSPFYVSFGLGTVGKVQLEYGAVATPFEARSIQLEIALCQRFYQIIFASARAPATAAGQLFDSTISFPTMRATPTTLLVSVGTNNNLNSIQIYTNAANWARFEMTANGSGDAYALTYGYSLSADL
jgi:hypothetical protein